MTKKCQKQAEAKSVINLQNYNFNQFKVEHPQVWIDNSYKANPGNSCRHAHFFFYERNQKQVCMVDTLHCRDPTRIHCRPNIHDEIDKDLLLIFNLQV